MSKAKNICKWKRSKSNTYPKVAFLWFLIIIILKVEVYIAIIRNQMTNRLPYKKKLLLVIWKIYNLKENMESYVSYKYYMWIKSFGNIWILLYIHELKFQNVCENIIFLKSIKFKFEYFKLIFDVTPHFVCLCH